MNSLFSIIQYKTRAIASAFMRGLNWDWVKKDWEENRAAILKCFLFWMMLPFTILPAAAALAVAAFRLTSPGFSFTTWPVVDYILYRLWFESASHQPPDQPPRFV